MKSNEQSQKMDSSNTPRSTANRQMGDPRIEQEHDEERQKGNPQRYDCRSFRGQYN